MSEKTEQPTPKRLRDARAKGQVAKSRMLAAAAATAGGMLGLSATATDSAARLHGWTTWLFLHPETGPKAALVQGVVVFAWFAVPVLLGAFGGSLVASAAMAGIQFNLGLVEPKLERVSPAAGLKRLFTLRQFGEIAKALVVALGVGWVFWSAVHDGGAQMLRATRLDGAMAMRVLFLRLGPVLGRAGGLLLALGVADYLWARKRHRNELMMTRQERKDEHKQAEGNPQHKGKRKALHRQLLQSGRARGVQAATCVVVNPTHLAVALRYDVAETDAPYLVAKAREEDALRLRRQAQELGIPVVKDIPLARSLIHYDVGEEIPEELYKAAAAVLKLALEAQETNVRPRRNNK